jgi:zinc protease
VCESPEESGYSHFIEHLTFKTTKSFPANQISFMIPDLGGMINAYTEFDTTCYYILLPSEHMSDGLKVLSEIANRADFSSADIKLERDIIIEEIKQYDNEPDSSFIEWIQNSYFISNPLRNPVLGTAQSVRKANLASLTAFYQAQYRPENSFLVISGDADPHIVQPILNQLFSTWLSPADNKPDSTPLSADIEKNGFRLFSQKKSIDNDFLAFVLPELIETHPLSEALLICARAFSAGKQSRLHKRLVEKDKTAIGIRLHSISGALPGITIIQIIPAHNSMVSDLIYAFFDEWKKLQRDGLTADEIDLVQHELYHSWLYDFEYIEGHANALASEELTTSYQDLYHYPERIAKVTQEQISKGLHTFWQQEYFAIYHQGSRKLDKCLRNNIIKLFTTSEEVQDSLEAYVPDCLAMMQAQLPEHRFPICNDITPIPQTPSPEVFREVRLECGMLVLLRQISHKPIIGVSLTTPLSQLNESESNKGINYFTSIHMLYGTNTTTYDDLQTIATRKGYSIKTTHTTDSTTLKGKCFPFHLEAMLTTAADILQNPTLPSRYLSLIKSNTLDYIKREKESPLSNAFTNWFQLIFGSQTNLYRPYGNVTQIRKINLAEIRAWHREMYHPAGFTMCVTGDFDFGRTLDHLNSLFPAQTLSSALPQSEYRYSSSAHREKLVYRHSDQAIVIIGGFGCPAKDRISNTAFYVLSQILGGELNSRFFNILREKHGFVYQTGFDFTSVHELGFWCGYAMCDAKDYTKVRALILDILQDIIVNSVTAMELASAQNYLLGMQRFDEESLSWQSNTLAVLYALGYDYDYFKHREQRIKAVTREQIQYIAQTWMQPENHFTYIEI